MTDAVQVLSVAEMLRNAYANGPIPPLREFLEVGDGAGAYEIQRCNTRFWLERGREIVGRKVGLTSPAVQKQLGVDQPDFGVLFADMAISNNGFLAPSKVIQAKAEAEIAFVLGRDIHDPLLSVSDALAAVDHVLPAIEIVDSRIAGWKITFADTVADNGSSAFYVVGETSKRPSGLDLEACEMTLRVNGDVVSTGNGAACLGNPINSLIWLARTLSAAGEGLRAGDILLTGALGPMITLNPGDKIDAVITGLGSCGFHFSEAGA